MKQDNLPAAFAFAIFLILATALLFYIVYPGEVLQILLIVDCLIGLSVLISGYLFFSRGNRSLSGGIIWVLIMIVIVFTAAILGLILILVDIGPLAF